MAIGKKIAETLAAESNFRENGAILAISGPLGAGKTTLVKGLAHFFNISEEITSPTYTIISEYEGKIGGKTLVFYHIDAYRLKGEDDFLDMGGEDYLYSAALCVIEWSENIKGCLPLDIYRLEMEICSGNGRNIRFSRDK